MSTTLTARRLITDIGEIEFPVLTLAPDGTLADISSDPRALHAETTVLTAALFDVHTHGGAGVDVMHATPDEATRLGQFLAAHGVGHFLPSTITASVDFTLAALDRIATHIERPRTPGEAIPVGIHLEGPFLSHAKRGMHPAADLQPPSVELFERFQTAASGHIRLVTIAPELVAEGGETALDFIRYLDAHNVRTSLGHTDATAAQMLAAADAGAASATHTFNAMRPFDHREPGALGIVLDDARLYAELICDGIHVSPVAVRLWWRTKGADRGILITDSLAAAGMSSGEFRLGNERVAVKDGRALVAADLAQGKETLAGSTLTMNTAVANLRRFTGASLSDATRAASHTPAAMLGQPAATRLAPGSPAHLARWSADGHLLATYIHGHEVSTGPGR